MASLDLLEELRAKFKPPIEVLEHQPSRELVASKDINRTDGLGRTVCACPKGQTPPRWLELTKAERDSLVEPPPPPPPGTLKPGPFGFTPEGVRVGFTIEHPQ